MKLIFCLYCCFVVFAQSVAQRKGTLQKFSKAFNGLYIFNDQLKEIFPMAAAEYTTNSVASTLKVKSFYHSAYIVIVNGFKPSATDLNSMEEYMREGNNIFIVAGEFNNSCNDFFKFETSFDFFDTANALTVKAGNIEELGPFTSKRLAGYSNCFIQYDSAKTTVLGYNKNGTPNFIRINRGAGALYIHLHPEMLMNYFLLEKENYKYTEAALSYLPRNTNEILIKLAKRESGQYSGEESSNGDFFSFIKNNPNLWAAFLLGLGLFGTIVLFGFKRRQREIPVVEPVKNNTLEFTKTIGDLYFNQKNNSDIAVKKILFWQEHIRTRFQIPTAHLSREFWEKLQKKSGAPPQMLEQLETQIMIARTATNLSDRDLVYLCNTIDQFNKI